MLKIGPINVRAPESVYIGQAAAQGSVTAATVHLQKLISALDEGNIGERSGYHLQTPLEIVGICISMDVMSSMEAINVDTNITCTDWDEGHG